MALPLIYGVWGKRTMHALITSCRVTFINYVMTRCIFFELLTGEVAFRGRDAREQLTLIFQTLGKPTEKEWSDVSKLR